MDKDVEKGTWELFKLIWKSCGWEGRTAVAGVITIATTWYVFILIMIHEIIKGALHG